jgi:CheY-like chemotaxis protein
METVMAAPTLLVVDDEPAITALIQRIAESCGFAVLATSRPEDLDMLMRRGDPDVICLDLAMPGMDGVELLLSLARRNCRSALVIISGFDRGMVSTALRLAEARGLHVAGTISKPIRIDEFRALLMQLRDAA